MRGERWRCVWWTGSVLASAGSVYAQAAVSSGQTPRGGRGFRRERHSHDVCHGTGRPPRLHNVLIALAASAMSPNVIIPIVVAPLIVWRLYARTRRNFGRQPIRPKRMWTRVGIFIVVALLVALSGLADPRLAAGLGVGLLGGALLGIVALRLTRFEIDGQNDCYFPNPWIGLALTALFLGRLIWRFMVVWPAMAHGAAAGGYPAAERSPLTLLILGLLLGYYIAYYGGLLIHHRRARVAQAATVRPNPVRPS